MDPPLCSLTSHTSHPTQKSNRLISNYIQAIVSQTLPRRWRGVACETYPCMGWQLSSLVPWHSPFFVLPFAFNSVHGSERLVKNGEDMGAAFITWMTSRLTQGTRKGRGSAAHALASECRAKYRHWGRERLEFGLYTAPLATIAHKILALFYNNTISLHATCTPFGTRLQVRERIYLQLSPSPYVCLVSTLMFVVFIPHSPSAWKCLLFMWESVHERRVGGGRTYILCHINLLFQWQM